MALAKQHSAVEASSLVIHCLKLAYNAAATWLCKRKGGEEEDGDVGRLDAVAAYMAGRMKKGGDEDVGREGEMQYAYIDWDD